MHHSLSTPVSCWVRFWVGAASIALASVPIQAQSEPEMSPTPDATAQEAAEPERTWIELEARRSWENVWVEIAPLRPGAQGVLLHVGRLEAVPEDGEPQRLDLGRRDLEQGTARVCFGADGAGIACELHFLYMSADGSGLPRGDRVSPVLLQAIPPEQLALTLVPRLGSAVVGRVVDDGLAVAGAEIRLRSVTAQTAADIDWPLPPPDLGSADLKTAWPRFRLTDEDGQFRLPPLAAGTYELEIRAPNGVVQRVGPFEVPDLEAPDDTTPELTSNDGAEAATPDDDGAESAVVDLGELSLRPGLSFEVRVVDELGKAVEGAWVTASQRDFELGPVAARSETDVDGKVLLSGFQARPTLTVICEAPGHAPQVRSFELLPVEVECLLPTLARVVGTVAVADADPLLPDTPPETDELGASEERRPGLPIQIVVSTVDVAGVVRATSAGAGGDFELAGLVPGPYVVTLAAPGFERRDIDIEAQPGERLDLGLVYLPAAPSVDGEVVDPETGEPVAGATVRVVEPLGGDETLTDARGRFRIATVGAGPLELEVFTDERPARRLRWSPAVQRGDAATRRIELPRGGWIRVLTGDAEREQAPCLGCTFRVVAPDSVRRASGEIPVLETDGQGEALSVPLPAGRYFVDKPRVERGGAGFQEIQDASRRFVRVHVGEIAEVRFAAGRDVRVRVEPPLDPATQGLVLQGAAWRQTGMEESATLAAGTLAAGTLAPGTLAPGSLYRFEAPETVGADLFLQQEGEGGRERIYLGPLPSAATKISITGPGRAQEILDVVPVSLGGSVLVGRLESLAGEPVAGARVRLRSVVDQRFLAETRSNLQGAFRIEHMVAGVYSLWVEDLAYKVVSVEKGRTVDLGILQPTPALLTRGGDGAP